MPKMSIEVDLADHKDIAYAADFLSSILDASEAVEQKLQHGEPMKGAPNVALPPAGDEVVTRGVSDATIAASPSDIAEGGGTPETELHTKRTARKAKDDIVVHNAAGEKLAGYAHSEMAADRFVIEWQKTTSREEMDALRKANQSSMARLANEDLERIQPLLAEHSLKIKEGVAPEPAKTPAGETSIDDQLTAAFSAPATAVSGVKMEHDEFVKAMLNLARQMGSPEASFWLPKQGFNAIKDVPEDKWATLIAAGEQHVKELAAKTS